MTKNGITVRTLIALSTLVVPSLVGPASPASADVSERSPAAERSRAVDQSRASERTRAVERSRADQRPRAVEGSADVDQSRDSVLVTGTGEVSGTPDTLVANVAVEAAASTVAEALNQAGTAVGRMRDALVRGGVAGADLQTSDVSVSSRKDNDNRITGYTVTQGLTAKIRNIPRAGAVLSAAVAAGGDAARLNGVSLAIEDDSALLAEARRKAFADARGKAELYARAAGRSLGPVIRVSEVAPDDAEPIALRGGMAAGDTTVPIEPGRQQLSATVTVEWALGGRAADRRG
ncbi:SIMPL domain-containing protein [Actinoplanes siamensis]|uniref:DUF541 domain-containing protein n=1 Tax=Actinoplanes siamensis TaxID=1223317 RepID=A0A919N0X5_9ACTN|nr:SIMPL domain-containing protein [Actinoplanes siamensis]GIF03404.1 hypothetical protein Asi03nite_09420 [Actinoplanes siamensis]